LSRRGFNRRLILAKNLPSVTIVCGQVLDKYYLLFEDSAVETASTQTLTHLRGLKTRRLKLRFSRHGFNRASYLGLIFFDWDSLVS